MAYKSVMAGEQDGIQKEGPCQSSQGRQEGRYGWLHVYKLSIRMLLGLLIL
jgi:hypothetical protein